MADRTTRQRKTPEQRAAETLGLAQRALARASKALDQHDAARAELEAAHKQALARVAYAEQDPALQQLELPTDPPGEPAGGNTRPVGA